MTDRRWTKQETEQLSLMWNTHSLRDIAIALGRSTRGVSRHASKHDLPQKPICSRLFSRWTKEADAQLREVFNDFSVMELAAMFNSTEKGVRTRAKELGLVRKEAWGSSRQVAEPLGDLEFSPGHVAVDRRSYQILTAASASFAR